jgi:hypothetical protein
MLYQALQYPFRGKGSFRLVLILALVQLVPIVGQLILLGYGFDIVRAVYAGQTSLPPIRWLPALGNGFRILVAGFFYLLPILLTIAVVGASRIDSSSSFGNLGVFGILLAIGLPLLLFLIGIVLHVGGVRYAIENKGLLAPMTNAKLLQIARIVRLRDLFNGFMVHVCQLQHKSRDT